MAGRERIAVTGLGLVTSLGFGREQSFSRLCAGERGISEVSLFDPSGLKSRIAAEVRGLDVRAIAPHGEADDWSRSDALSFVAAREALAQAGHIEGSPLGLALGGTTGGMYETERALAAILPGRVAPHDARRLLDFPLAVSVERVARALGNVAPLATVCSACSSGAVAIALGASWLLSGRASRVLAGGVDGLCQLTFTGFSALGAVDPEPSRPFDAGRAGLTLGEGAGCLVLELESSARARGVPIIAFLSGWAVASEAHHVTHPEPTGTRAARVLSDAMAVAGLATGEVDYVNAHGTGTVQNDAMEARALERVFGADVGRVWVSSSKAQIGHTLGAAGAIEAAITALSVNRGLLPPTAGLERPEAPALRHVRAPNQSAQLRAALSSSFGFGGACAVLAFEAPSAEPRSLSRKLTAEVVISGAASYGPAGVLRGHDSRRYLAEPAPSGAQLPEPLGLLDPERSRRFSRASAIVIATAESALRDAQHDPTETGFVVGSAFGDVERSVRFLQKVLGQGPKFASPAEFPQLIASTGSGNASIYLGLTGPCLSVSEFGTSGESAVSVAISLLELGLATALLAGAAEARDTIVDAVLGEDGSRSEGGGFVVLEELPAALARGHTPLAVVAEHHALRGAPLSVFAALPAPPSQACIVAGFLPPSLAGVLEGSKWRDVRLFSLPATLGQHEAIGATALAVAVGEVASGAAEQALVITADLNTVYLTRLCRYEARA
ncbi:MAG TPA: beta-ketoacyl-[acyl-carrier-protein] synthase family protein [Polyangiaceae bacterium]|nr:beta-ketoacyl-[acyl-carrier-protein] synthase family protein [Polyangiaceae bacterium]